MTLDTTKPSLWNMLFLCWLVASVSTLGSLFFSEVMERALRQIAGVFDVTKYEAKLRALQLGYKQAEGAFLRVDGHERSPFSFNPDVLGDHQTFILDSKNAARLYKEDSHFAELIDSKRFVYTGHVVVINSPLYVIKTGDPSYPQGYKLTDFALGHVDLCCLIFTRNYTQNDAIAEYYDQCYFSKEVNVADFKETRTIDYSVNKDVEAEALGLKGYDDEGERLAEILAPVGLTPALLKAEGRYVEDVY